MKKAFFLIIFLVCISIKSEAQKISISTDKESYKSKDAIEISLANNSSMDLVYVIALESKINNKWVEMESDIIMMGMKSEIVRTIKKKEVLKKKILLPKYIVKLITRNDSKIRFRVKAGLSYNKASIIYSNEIKISIGSS